MTAGRTAAADAGIMAIAGPAWRMAIWPALGGALVSAEARHGGAWLDVTPPVDEAILAERDILKLGGFPLAPFCNRIEGAAFVYDGVRIEAPRNWPPDPALSIHGLSWQRPWIVASLGEERLELVQRVEQGGAGFRYEARLTLDVAADCAKQTLSVSNTGERTLPFGLGFHPYFRRTPGSAISFDADGWLEPDSRCFPLGWKPLPPEWDGRNARPVQALAGLDAAFTGWKGQVILTWPELETQLSIEASAAARLLHVFVPADGRQFLCLEPVSHVIDVHNRRELARYGDVTPLAPGETMSLGMKWRLAHFVMPQPAFS